MKTKLFLLLLITIVGFALPSCRKKGCGDPSAENYESNIKVDDCSCIYRNFISADVAYFPFKYADGSPVDTTFSHLLSAVVTHTSFTADVSFDTVRYFCNLHYLSLPLKSSGKVDRGRGYTYILYSGGVVMASGDISPFQETSPGKVTVHGQNGTIITFNYIVQ
jgi:hypothetical protein